MSYCRSGPDSDVYLIHSSDGFDCFAMLGTKRTKLTPHRPIHTMSQRTEVMRHLAEHREAGDKVPERAFRRIVEEFLEVGDHHGRD